MNMKGKEVFSSKMNTGTVNGIQDSSLQTRHEAVAQTLASCTETLLVFSCRFDLPPSSPYPTSALPCCQLSNSTVQCLAESQAPGRVEKTGLNK